MRIIQFRNLSQQKVRINGTRILILRDSTIGITSKLGAECTSKPPHLQRTSLCTPASIMREERLDGMRRARACFHQRDPHMKIRGTECSHSGIPFDMGIIWITRSMIQQKNAQIRR